MTLRIPVSKLPNTGTTIFTVMSRLAEQHGAVNLSQGFPDFDPPRRLIELVSRHLAGHRNQYAPMAGVMALRETIAAEVERRFGVAPDVESEITITSGATEAIFCAVLALAGSGEEVIVFDPAYDSYAPAITLAGAATVHLPLAPPDFRIDFDRLKAALNERTRLVVINTPHNPSGTLLAREELAELAATLAPWDCYLLSDEVYEHIVFDPAGHAGILANPALRDRGIAISSYGKTFHATGWKVGYAIAPAPLTSELRRVHQFCTFATTTPIQHAIADYLLENPVHYTALPELYREKRDDFLSAMTGTPFRFTPAAGTYFQLADYGAISDLDDVEFSRRLTVEHGVATIPISVFYESPPEARLVRFCFAKQAATLTEAARRLAGIRRIEA
ncbi:MAG TPA: methionine aminotransferase [Gammaproteobacteria bacterium]|nr:methionine aminotransferase [Gammaproteobacteria bacterium]